jgi:hypothetical protein
MRSIKVVLDLAFYNVRKRNRFANTSTVFQSSAWTTRVFWLCSCLLFLLAVLSLLQIQLDLSSLLCMHPQFLQHCDIAAGPANPEDFASAAEYNPRRRRLQVAGSEGSTPGSLYRELSSWCNPEQLEHSLQVLALHYCLS